MAASELTALYRARLGASNAGLLARLDALWRSLYDPRDPVGSIARIAAAAAELISGGQTSSAAEAAAYLRALTADAAAAPLVAVEPYAVPPGITGATAAGLPMGQLTSVALAVYRKGLLGGAEPAAAASSAYGWLNRIGASEPYRAANVTVATNAYDDPRLTGRVNRITTPDACDWCKLLADRGYIPVPPGVKAHAGFECHAHCNCTASPEISSHVYGPKGARRVRDARAAYPPPVSVPAPRPAPLPVPAPRPAPKGYQVTGLTNPAVEERVRSTVDAALAPLAPKYRQQFQAVVALPDAEFETEAARVMPSRPSVANVQGYYTYGSNRFVTRRSIGSAEADATARKCCQSGWWVPTASVKDGRGTGSVESVMSHELGHFVWRDVLNDRQRRMVAPKVEALLPQPTAKTQRGADYQWSKTVARKVSTYAATDRDEFYAELWCEYTMSPRPRAVAKAYGDLVVALAGGK